MALKAIKHIRRLRGGSQAQLMTAADGNDYVVKFQDNPQTTRVLANEYLAGSLARMLGLNVPEVAIIHVGLDIIRQYGISFQLGGTEVTCPAGLHFVSRLIVDEEVHDWLPTVWIGRIRNFREFAGVLAFDKWTGNADGRQVVFHKRQTQRRYAAAFIDFGYCFNAAEWSFPDSSLRGAYARQEVYQHIRSWRDFEPWLSRIETLRLSALRSIAAEIPAEWYGDSCDLDRLVEGLFTRRGLVRELIDDFRKSNRNPFPNWGDSYPNAATENYDVCRSISAPDSRVVVRM